MHILNRLLRRTETEPSTSTNRECLHGVLTPYWRNADEIGREYSIAGYRCQSCMQLFNPEEAYWLWLRAVDRLRDLEGVGQRN
jgi:hypothetical protein